MGSSGFVDMDMSINDSRRDNVPGRVYKLGTGSQSYCHLARILGIGNFNTINALAVNEYRPGNDAFGSDNAAG